MRSVSCTPFLTAILAVSFAALAVADPLPGRDVLKFQQLPMLATPIQTGTSPTDITIYRGHDELSTAYGIRDATQPIVTQYFGRFMADDFADNFNSPVVHVRWWGSYLDTLSQTMPVDRFLISFEEDVPVTAGINDFSHPGKPLLNQIVRRGPLFPGSGTFTEVPVGFSDADGPTFEYNAELHLGKEFPQVADKIYWLKIVALYDVDPNTPEELLPKWGWHNRDYTIMDPLASPFPMPGEHVQGVLTPPDGTTIPIWHFQDDAVEGFVEITMDPDDPMSFIMPEVEQFEYRPTHYQEPWDGPPGIGQFSKDLAFELYTVPEPGSFLLLSLAMVSFALRSRRSR